jgi:5-methylcytosine-specific restriction protein A
MSSPLYSKARWRKIARAQLAREPTCRLCAAEGVVTAACIADHITPWRGDVMKFWTSPLQSLCKSCHDGRKKFVENRGYSDAIGENGEPLDPKHPWYRGYEQPRKQP